MTTNSSNKAGVLILLLVTAGLIAMSAFLGFQMFTEETPADDDDVIVDNQACEANLSCSTEDVVGASQCLKDNTLVECCPSGERLKRCDNDKVYCTGSVPSDCEEDDDDVTTLPASDGGPTCASSNVQLNWDYNGVTYTNEGYNLYSVTSAELIYHSTKPIVFIPGDCGSPTAGTWSMGLFDQYGSLYHSLANNGPGGSTFEGNFPVNSTRYVSCFRDKVGGGLYLCAGELYNRVGIGIRNHGNVCGNGVKENAEQCDDGNNNNSDSCSNTCTILGCGDGVCGTGETSATCPSDCPATCGNNICDTGETLNSCPGDCSVCGDGICSGLENANTCSSDCVQNTPSTAIFSKQYDYLIFGIVFLLLGGLAVKARNNKENASEL